MKRQRRSRGSLWGGLALLAAAALWRFGLATRGGTDTFPGANVLLITLDTTRADHIGAFSRQTNVKVFQRASYSPAETPHLDALAREGVLFSNATSSIPLTLPAHASLLTGREPSRHGVRDNSGFRLAEDHLTLAEALKSQGYRTFAAVGSFVLGRETGLAQGFDEYDDVFGTVRGAGPPSSAVTEEGEERPGEEVVDRALLWLEAHRQERFAAWLHFYDPHRPYAPRGGFAERYHADPYSGEIAYVDAQVGRVFDWLKEKGLYESTLVVVLGDHGEGLGEHQEPDHGVFLYDATLRIPLIVRAPHRRYRGRVERLARDIDVMPTVLDLLGAPVPAAVRGRSLRPLLAGRADPARVAYAESYYARYHYGWSPLLSLRDDRYKLIEAPEPELYDLVADPGEAHNIIAARPKIADGLRAHLQELRKEVGSDAGDGAPTAVDGEAAERLRSLGYVAGVVKAASNDLPDPKVRASSLTLFSEIVPRALRLLEDGKGAEAERLLDEALAREVFYLDGHVLRGRALSLQGRHDEAIASLQTALRLDPESAATLIDLAQAHAARGDLKASLTRLTEAQRLAPGEARIYVAQADVYRALGRLDAALGAVRALLVERPDDAQAHLEAGRLHLQMKHLDAAQEEFRTALGLRRSLETAHYNMALIAEARGDRAAARREYEEELRQFPRNHEAWTNLGVLEMEQGSRASGTEAFRKVIALRPDLYEGHFLLARALLGAGRLDQELLDHARRAVALAPQAKGPQALLAQIQRVQRVQRRMGGRSGLATRE